LYEQGFDEFMNLVVDEAAEVYAKDAKPRRELGTLPGFAMGIHQCSCVSTSGRILLKGDNITLIQQVA
jgi:small nuclear ribonucleoprotein (snRNP)-like protein